MLLKIFFVMLLHFYFKTNFTVNSNKQTNMESPEDLCEENSRFSLVS